VVRLTKPLLLAGAVLFLACSSARAAELHVHWMRGYAAPGTPARYDKVGVLEVGPRAAHNVLVLEPGTSAGSAYFLPLAQWLVSRVHGWQVWSVERRENLLEDQSRLNLAKAGQATATELFDYYLGWLIPGAYSGPHIRLIPTSKVSFAKQWGMKVAVEDLHDVIEAARRLGGKVVLGGHSLGGAVVTAYATWDFDGHAGADDLAGLVYIDGGSGPGVNVPTAREELTVLDSSETSPWLTFGGIAAPFAGLFSATGATAALIDPNGASLGQTSGLLSAFHLTPDVPVTNLAQFGFALNVPTSPPTLMAAQAHLGAGLSAVGPPYGWNSAGALTPITRYADMLSGLGVDGADGTEWYFPDRLAIDTGAIGNGIANPAQQVLGVDATMGRRLPKNLQIYAFATRLGGTGVLADALGLAAQSGISFKNVSLINRSSSYAHNDPAGAYPRNAFFTGLLRFLHRFQPPPKKTPPPRSTH
jgi:pimeloyl-ACP methyl ester carboxylesterase